MSHDFHASLGTLAWVQLWQVTAVAVAVAVVVRFFAHRRPHFAHVLCLVVVVKCLVPPVWSSPVGIFSWLRARTTQGFPADGLPEAVSQDAKTALEPASPLAAEETPPHGRERPLSTTIVLGAAWLLGSVSLAAYTVVRRGTRSAALRTAYLAPPPVQRLLEDYSVRLRLRRRIRLLVTPEPLAPGCFGLLRPTIVLPATLVSGPADTLRCVLAHELLHVGRNDAAIEGLQQLAQMLWWFHPLVWWSNARLRRFRELCCDEGTIAVLRCRPSLYAKALLDVEQRKWQFEPLSGVPSMRPFDITRERLAHLLGYRRPFRRRAPGSSWLALGLGLALATPGAALVRNADRPRPLLADSFDGPALEAGVWTVARGTVQALEGQLVLRDRGCVVTRAVFRQPLSVSFDWQWRDVGGSATYPDILSVVLRGDGLLKDAWAYEAAHGLVVKFHGRAGVVSLDDLATGRRLAVLPDGSVPIPPDKWHRVRITDDGQTVTAYIAPRESPARLAAPVLQVRAPRQDENGRIAVYNRESVAGVLHESRVDNFAAHAFPAGSTSVGGAGNPTMPNGRP